MSWHPNSLVQWTALLTRGRKWSTQAAFSLSIRFKTGRKRCIQTAWHVRLLRNLLRQLCRRTIPNHKMLTRSLTTNTSWTSAFLSQSLTHRSISGCRDRSRKTLNRPYRGWEQVLVIATCEIRAWWSLRSLKELSKMIFFLIQRLRSTWWRSTKWTASKISDPLAKFRPTKIVPAQSIYFTSLNEIETAVAECALIGITRISIFTQN